MAQIIRRGKKTGLENTKIEGFGFWDDPRWVEVRRLRASDSPGDKAKADKLEERINKHWKVG